MDKRFKINDNRPISNFSKNSFMGQSINSGFTNLRNLLTREPDIDKILYIAFDLLCSGKCVKLYQFILSFYCKSINVKNPKFPFTFYTRYSYLIKLDDYYREVLKGDKSLELIYRNDQAIRNHLTEMLYILLESNKCKNSLTLPGVKDMPPRTPAILNYTEKFVYPGDSPELGLALNEFIFYIRSNEIKKAIRWLSWVIQVEKLKLKMRQFIAIKPREISGIPAEFKGDILWVFWNYILAEVKKRDTVIARQVTSLFNIYKYNFNPKNRKIHLLLTATSFISEFYSINTPLVMNMPRMIELTMKSNILFNSFKNKEKIILDVEENREDKSVGKKINNEKLLLQNEIDRILLEKTRTI